MSVAHLDLPARWVRTVLSTDGGREEVRGVHATNEHGDVGLFTLKNRVFISCVEGRPIVPNDKERADVAQDVLMQLHSLSNAEHVDELLSSDIEAVFQCVMISLASDAPGARRTEDPVNIGQICKLASVLRQTSPFSQVRVLDVNIKHSL